MRRLRRLSSDCPLSGERSEVPPPQSQIDYAPRVLPDEGQEPRADQNDDRHQAAMQPPEAFAHWLLQKVRDVLRKHGRKLWWLHSAYALGLGLTVVAFAQKGFDHARWLAVTVGAAWLLVVLFFRIFGSGEAQARVHTAGGNVRFRFFAMTYVLKNLYQGMLFFLLPFYWKSTTFAGKNAFFLVLLATCALVSTLDIVFDRVVFRIRALASVFHGIALFGCLNLVVPALFPNTRTLTSLLVAAGVTVVAFWTIHVNLAMTRDRRWLFVFAASMAAALGAVYALRASIPPVPMYLAKGAVGPIVLPDGRLGMVVHELHPSVIDKLIAITDVVVPGGKGDRLLHVWRHDGHEIHRATETTSRVDGPSKTVRLRSALSGRELPQHLVGEWAIDVETEDNQLVGRVSFVVAE